MLAFTEDLLSPLKKVCVIFGLQRALNLDQVFIPYGWAEGVRIVTRVGAHRVGVASHSRAMPPLVLLIVHASIENPLDFDLLIVHLLEVVINYGGCLAAVPHVLKKLKLFPLELLLELASDLLLLFKLPTFDGRHV
jgi:hypothetical protein